MHKSEHNRTFEVADVFGARVDANFFSFANVRLAQREHAKRRSIMRLKVHQSETQRHFIEDPSRRSPGLRSRDLETLRLGSAGTD